MENLKIKLVITDGEREIKVSEINLFDYQKTKDLHGVSLLDEIIEEALKIKIKELDNELINKYDRLYFLEGVPEEDKLVLSQLYEDFTKFLINVDNCEENFETLFIPITKKLYLDFKEVDFIKIFKMYSEWCDEHTLENDEDIFKGFVGYYKSKH